MDDGFIAKALDKRRIDQAFPLVRAIAPELTVERWRRFATGMIGRRCGAVPPRGIMTAQNGRGYIHGLFSYSVEDHLRHGRILIVENFVALDLFDLSGAASTLLRSMDAIARSLSCSAIHTNFPDSHGGLHDYCRTVMTFFREEGHVAGTLRLCKSVEGVNDNVIRTLAGAHDEA